MLYTVSCGFISGSLIYVGCKILGVEFEHRGYVRTPGLGDILVCAGTIFGLGVGAAVDGYKFYNGNYFHLF